MPLTKAKASFAGALDGSEEGRARPSAGASGGGTAVATATQLEHGSVVIAAITSCTNTSNPSVMIGAGLVAKKAVEHGLTRKPWVKTSLAPGSKVVTDYLKKAGLDTYLDQIGFNLVGYGCTTCIGNSGPLPEEVSAEIAERGLVVASVLSGNRNFEGRIQQEVRANYLASPPLVVAYALAGSMTIDITTEPLGTGTDGKPVYLKDVWPTREGDPGDDAASVTVGGVSHSSTPACSTATSAGRRCRCPTGDRFAWDDRLHLHPQAAVPREPVDDAGAADRHSPARARWRVLGDSITTDHISPAGGIKADSPAGKYLIEHGVEPKDFNSYGARRGNHEVMMRGTFANTRIKNQMVPGRRGRRDGLPARRRA